MCLKRAMPLSFVVWENFLLIDRRIVTYLIKTYQHAFRCCMRPDPDDKYTSDHECAHVMSTDLYCLIWFILSQLLDDVMK